MGKGRADVRVVRRTRRRVLKMRVRIVGFIVGFVDGGDGEEGLRLS